MWRELIHSLEPHAQYAPGASESQIAELCEAFSLVLSEDLRILLKESNGVQDPSGFCIIWSTEEISQYNREMRNFHCPWVNTHNTCSFVYLLCNLFHHPSAKKDIRNSHARAAPILIRRERASDAA
jgi:hypothetical protein